MAVPVYLVAGFLGSGKTTLLKRMVEHLNQKGENPLVLMNEFGETNVDSELLEGSNAQMRELIDGCICCTSKTDLSRTLFDIAVNDTPSTILLEATGLADPVEILDICTLPNLLDKLELRSIVSVVDANRFGKVGQVAELMERQAKYADTILLNKTDLVSDDEAEQLERDLRNLNARAELKRTVRADVEVASLFSDSATGVVCDKEDHTHCDHGPHDHHHHHDHDHHHHGHHHDHFLSFTIEVGGVADRAKFEDFLKRGAKGLLRLKGFVHVEGLEPQAVLQWTAGDWELIRMPTTMKPKKDVLVFIGDAIDREAIRAELQDCGFEIAEVAHEH